jgi:hypothetical protein
MSAPQQSACPVCGGNGFVGVVSERRRRLVRRAGTTTTGARSADASRCMHVAGGRLPYWPASWSPLDEGCDGWGKVFQLAHVLLWTFGGDRETVAAILEDFANHRSKALSREGWFRAAADVRAGEIR